MLPALFFAALLSASPAQGQAPAPQNPGLTRSPCPEGACYSNSVGRTIFWVTAVPEADAAYTGSPRLQAMQAEYDAWAESLPPLTIHGLGLFNRQAVTTTGPALEDDQFFPLKFIRPDGRLNKRTLAIPLYRCRWRLAILLSRIEEEERRLDSNSLGLDPKVLYKTFRERGYLYLSRERLSRQTEALLLAHQAAVEFARHLKAIPSSGPSAGPGKDDDDRLEADLITEDALEELYGLEDEMEEAMLFAERLRDAYEALEGQ